MNINWHVTYVYFNDVKPLVEFKFNECIPFADLKYILQDLLPYEDNWKIVKLEYCSPSIDNEGKIEFNNFELKTGANLRAVWNIFSSLETKLVIEVDAIILRSIKYIMKMLKRTEEYWNVMFDLS